MTTEDDPLHDCELDPGAILGTLTFEDLLFTDETETPVNVLTGETPAQSRAIVEEGWSAERAGVCRSEGSVEGSE